MRPYWAFFRTRFLALLQYRAAAIAGIGTQWLFGYVRVMALWAFYQSAGTAQPSAVAGTPAPPGQVPAPAAAPPPPRPHASIT